MFNLQDACTPLMEQLLFFHDHSMFFIVMILTFVGYVLVLILINKVINLFLLFNELVEMIWTLLPSIVLIFIALPSLKVLYLSDEVSSSSLTMKAIGHQWYWSYEYSDFENLEFDSYMSQNLESDSFRCLDVDNRVVLPVSTSMRVVVTSGDVIHSWALPTMGVKVDANPGRLNQCMISSDYLGLFYGQCSEICGVLHSFMPICVEVVSIKDFLSWVSHSTN
uniref:Cytochrome c oxidase subunit 2 n=1 Tax=Myrsidea sp. ADS-2020 TaxID=2794901 RepID=A0A7T1HF16_9NEOP|nr:cytochrome c oxidase subunit 2 [Myrsidea sp. ADS-2020]